jgi:hypothetical protein
MDSVNLPIEAANKPLCPKADQIPNPFLIEYLAMANNPSTQWTKNPVETEERQYYRVNGHGQSFFVGLKPNSDPKLPESVRYIGHLSSDLSGTVDRADTYENGLRTEMFFYNTTSTTRTYISAKFSTENGEPYVASEFSHSYGIGVPDPKPAYVDAKFDKSGKVTEYRTGDGLGTLVPTKCSP